MRISISSFVVFLYKISFISYSLNNLSSNICPQSVVLYSPSFMFYPHKLEFARFYKRCTGRTKSAMGACSQSADFRTGCIARQRDMSMKRSVMRMAPHYDNIFSCIGCFFVIPNIHPILPYTFIRNWGIFSYFNNFPIVL